MEHIKINFIVLSVFLLCAVVCMQAKRFAVVSVPVLDIGEKTTLTVQDQSTVTDIPISGGRINQLVACKRAHQLLFNEIIEILKYHGTKVHISVPNIFFSSGFTGKKDNTFWVENRHLIPCKDLQKHAIDLDKIPKPISFQKRNWLADETVATLCMPFTDPRTKISYSAGTRFKKVEQVLDDQAKTTSVYVLDPQSMKLNIVQIPSQLLLKPALTPEKKIKQFVQLLKTWAHLYKDSIPYVWGGSSFIYTSSGDFKEVIAWDNSTQTSYFDLKNYHFNPKPGFDCSGLILRAAQICDIPYYLKNSATAAHYLKPIKHSEQVEDGDIIWLPKGHVIVVSSVKQNMLIEARSYEHGFGKIHEIALNKVFKDINTCEQLHDAFKEKQTIYRIDSQEKIADTFNHFKILKLASVWKI